MAGTKEQTLVRLVLCACACVFVFVCGGVGYPAVEASTSASDPPHPAYVDEIPARDNTDTHTNHTNHTNRHEIVSVVPDPALFVRVGARAVLFIPVGREMRSNMIRICGPGTIGHATHWSRRFSRAGKGSVAEMLRV